MKPENIDYPFLLTFHPKSIWGPLSGLKDKFSVYTVYNLSILSEGVVLSDRVSLDENLYNRFKNDEERYGINIDSIFYNIYAETSDDLKEVIGKHVSDMEKFKYQRDDIFSEITEGRKLEDLTKVELINLLEKIYKTQFGQAVLKIQHYSQYNRMFLRPAMHDFFENFDDPDNVSSGINEITHVLPFDLLPDLEISEKLENTYRLDDIYGYRKLVEIYKKKIDKVTGIKLENHLDKKSIYLPPIFSLVLERAKSIDEIPWAIKNVKDEFKDLTDSHRAYKNELSEANSLKEELEIIEEYEESEKVLTEKLASKTKKRSMVRYFINIFKSLDPKGITESAFDKLLEYDADRIAISRVNRYVDLYDQVIESRTAQKNIRRLFGDIKFSDHDLRLLRKLSK